MDSPGNVNRAISIVGYWIFDSNYEKALFLTKESFYIICSPSIFEEKGLMFQAVFYAVIFIWAPININKG